MNADPPRWQALPVLRALHDAWWAARGARLGASQRPFSRDWEELLEQAGLLSADQRREAERDARELAVAGLVELRPVKYRPHLIARIQVPLAAELRLAALFGDDIASEDEGIDLNAIAWEPELRFVPDSRLGVAKADLRLLNEFLAKGGRKRDMVPVKERSLQIFGDEKRLEALLPSALFREDRLTLAMLRCESVGEPLGWQRGPNREGPLLVLENAATWHSYCRWNAAAGEFSAVVYGKGLVITDSVRYLADLFTEIGGVRHVFYFGDLDPPGLMIPLRASQAAQKHGLPALEPHLWSYRHLLAVGKGKESAWEGEPVTEAALAWINELSEPVRALFAAGKRLAQEVIGWEFLKTQPPPHPFGNSMIGSPPFSPVRFSHPEG